MRYGLEGCVNENSRLRGEVRRKGCQGEAGQEGTMGRHASRRSMCVGRKERPSPAYRCERTNQGDCNQDERG